MATLYTFTFVTGVRGYYVYQDIWRPEIGDVLHCEREIGNSHNTFAVAIRNDTEIVGHVPRLLLAIYSLY